MCVCERERERESGRDCHEGDSERKESMCLSRLTDSNLADCSTAERVVESRAGRGRPVVTQGNNDILYRPETKKKYTVFFFVFVAAH